MKQKLCAMDTAAPGDIPREALTVPIEDCLGIRRTQGQGHEVVEY